MAEATSFLDAADALTRAERVVIKIGSALLVDREVGLQSAWLAALAADVAALRRRGADVALVSSGAIALGRAALTLPDALALDEAQAAAAVGQIALARAYAEALEAEGLQAGQVLLTLEDTQVRRRYLNGRATLRMLLARGVTPVVNENDTVATDEIRYGDNDRLAARVAVMAGADLLVLLSDVDGLYDGDPRRDPSARRVDRVDEITTDIEAMAAGPAGPHAKGGMVTKLLAAKIATEGGAAMLIAKGRPGAAADLGPLAALRAGGPSTLFTASASPQAARKQWIAGMAAKGALVVDAGAAAALGRGKSLLPAGVIAVRGAFERGDPVAIETEAGVALGQALTTYSAADARLIAGRRSREIAAALGHPGRSEMAHRDDMALWRAADDAPDPGRRL